MSERDLVITVKLAQFLTDRAQSGTNRFRMTPGVSWTKKIEKGGEKIHVLGVARAWFSDYRRTRSILNW